jgi:hypothetical protein
VVMSRAVGRAAARRAAGETAGGNGKTGSACRPAVAPGSDSPFDLRRHRHARRLAHVGIGPPAAPGDRGAVHQLAWPRTKPPRSHGRRPPGRGRDAARKRQDWIGLSASSGAGQQFAWPPTPGIITHATSRMSRSVREQPQETEGPAIWLAGAQTAPGDAIADCGPVRWPPRIWFILRRGTARRAAGRSRPAVARPPRSGDGQRCSETAQAGAGCRGVERKRDR